MLKKAYNSGIVWDYAGRNVRASKPQTRGSWGRGGGVIFFQILAVRMSLCAFLDAKNDSTNPTDG